MYSICIGLYEMNCGQNKIVRLGCLYCKHIYKHYIITSIYVAVVTSFRWPSPFSDFKHGNMVHRHGIPLKVDEVEPKSMLLRSTKNTHPSYKHSVSAIHLSEDLHAFNFVYRQNPSSTRSWRKLPSFWWLTSNLTWTGKIVVLSTLKWNTKPISTIGSTS